VKAEVHFDVEAMITSGDRVFVLWRYSWADGHVRGADVMRVRDGQVAESFAYVKDDGCPAPDDGSDVAARRDNSRPERR